MFTPSSGYSHNDSFETRIANVITHAVNMGETWFPTSELDIALAILKPLYNHIIVVQAHPVPGWVRISAHNYTWHTGNQVITTI